MKTNKKRPIAKQRESSGYALVAVMTVSVFAMLLLLSLAGLSASVMQTEGFYKQRNLGLAGAEVGLDYAVKLLNESLAPGAPPCPIAPVDGETERISDLPADLVPQAGSTACKVRIRIRKLSPENIADMTSAQMDSPLIESQWNPNRHRNIDNFTTYGDQHWQDFSAPTLSFYWMVEVTSYRGIMATSLRSVVAPAIDADKTLAPSKSNTGFFPNTVVANSEVQVGAQPDGSILVMPTNGDWVETGTDNADFTGNIQTNGSVSVANFSTVIGNLLVTNPTNGAPSSVVSGQPLTIFGRIEANSAVDPSPNLRGTPGQLPDWSNDNVYAMADLFNGQSERLGPNTTPVNPTASQTPYSPIQVPTAQSNSSILPMFPQDDGSGTPPPDVSIAPTDFQTNSLDSTGAVSKMIINSPEFTSTTPTRIYIDPNTSADYAVNIDSEMFNNQGSATNLQIYYAGNKPININLSGVGEFKGIIYAPNSTVSTSGIGDFFGAIVANKVNANHVGSLQLDQAARNIVMSGSTGGGGGNGNGVGTNAGITPNKYRVATWQQVNGGIVPQAQ